MVAPQRPRQIQTVHHLQGRRERLIRLVRPEKYTLRHRRCIHNNPALLFHLRQQSSFERENASALVFGEVGNIRIFNNIQALKR